MRVLSIIPGAIGDFILTLPAVAWLRSRFEPAWLELWVSRVNQQLAQSLSYVDRSVALEDTGIERYPVAESCLQRMQNFDRVLSWWGTGNSEFVDSVNQVHGQVQFLRALPHDSTLHMIDFRKAQLADLFGGAERFSAIPEISWSQDTVGFAQHFWAENPGPPRAVIHPGASGQRKRWPAKQFAELAKRLARTERTNILLLEGPLDAGAVNEVHAAAQENSIPLGRMKIQNLSRLAAVLSHCQLYVGNDSGITHLAAAVGIPTVAIFLSTNPRIWGPRGAQVRLLTRPTVDEVFSSIHH